MQKIVLITGGGRGIGAATAIAAAQAGYDVAVNYVTNKGAADRIVEQVTQQGRRAISVAADLAEEDQIVSMFKIVDRDLGPLTALVNNGGIVSQSRRVDALDAQSLQHIFRVNVIGSFICAREAIKRMSLRHGGNGGAIVNVSSGAAVSGAPNEYVDYASTKGAIDTFTVGLAKELAPEGVRVNAVRPGFIKTDIHQSSGIKDRLKQVVSRIPMGRVGEPEEIANAIIWLLSDEASFTTGANLDIRGGA